MCHLKILHDRKETNVIFEFSTQNTIRITLFVLCDKKHLTFCKPVLLDGINIMLQKFTVINIDASTIYL
jgi:hypothetical protein